MKTDSYLQIDIEFAYLSIAAIVFTIPMAERATFTSYSIYTLLLAGFLYPSLVAWIWGGGWL
jgi:ammonia channel protein AmtB